MKSLARWTGFSLAVSASLWAATASADMPPPDGYVETCTIDYQQTEGLECVECGTYYAEPNACADQWAAQGYTSMCHTWGASAWGEVWCRPAQGDASGTGTGTGDLGAQVDPHNDETSPWAAPLAIGLSGLVVAPWLIRRKR